MPKSPLAVVKWNISTLSNWTRLPGNKWDTRPLHQAGLFVRDRSYRVWFDTIMGVAGQGIGLAQDGESNFRIFTRNSVVKNIAYHF